MRTLLSIALCSCLIASGAAHSNGGLWSHSAVSIWSGSTDVIPSPDGQKKWIVIRPPRNPESDQTHTVSINANGRVYNTQIGAWVNAEAAWSADSQAFFVTYSDGGNVGTYHLKIVYVSSTGLRIIEPVPNGRKLFAPICFAPERPNVAGIRWTGNDTSHLLIAVQVPPHSSCASLGTFQAFQIAVPDGTVLSRYGQIQSKKLLGPCLGVELLGADDSCVHNPGTCVPAGDLRPILFQSCHVCFAKKDKGKLLSLKWAAGDTFVFRRCFDL